MVSKYYVSARPQTNDYHPVHKDGCPFLSDNEYIIDFGLFSSDKEAALESQNYFTKTVCCRFCMKEQSIDESIPLFKGINIESIFSAEKQLSMALRSMLLCILN